MTKDRIVEYQHSYNSALLRGTDLTARPPLAIELALKQAAHDKKLLDIGCGTAYKTLKLVNHFQQIIGLEPSHDLLSLAKDAIYAQKIFNFHLVKGVGECLPLKAHQFDVVTSILSWWSAAEAARVLKARGMLLVECLGPDDKKSFTQFFGKDKHGWRGANLNTHLAEMKQHIHKELSPYFASIDIQNVTWQTAYSIEGLWLLLQNTKSTVRNFNPVEDRGKFDAAIAYLNNNNQIVLTQNRLLITAIK